MGTLLDFTRVRTPLDQGGVLVEPEPTRLAALVQANRRRLAQTDVPIGKHKLAEVRQAVRSAAGGSDQPLIVTGHQPDFIHAGVWAKHVVADRLAKALGGTAVNLVVDHDAPRRLALAIPLIRSDELRLVEVLYGDWPSGAALEGMPPANDEACSLLRDEVRRAMGPLDDESHMPRFFAVYGEGTASADWVDQAVAARRAVEHDLGVRVEDRRVSALWCGPLLGVLIGDAERFAAEYNGVLGDYRRRFRVRGQHRPIPDLDVGAGVCETPLWVYRLGEPRRRLFVRRTAGALELMADREVIASLDPARVADWESLNADLCALLPWRIRPRALMLTLWARLLLADLFIHGIGGAKYDRITDELIRRYFGIAPPAMACVSATLRLPLACTRVGADDVRRARRRLRDVQYNPERYLPDGAVGALAAQKHALVSESQRLRREAPQQHRARREVFLRIRELNETMIAADRTLVGQLAEQLHATERAAAQCSVAEYRAFFFAMHRRQDLERLMANLPDVTQLRATAIV